MQLSSECDTKALSQARSFQKFQVKTSITICDIDFLIPYILRSKGDNWILVEYQIRIDAIGGNFE